eukprot:jgi/Ulvmu1/3853/UM018_0072.1
MADSEVAQLVRSLLEDVGEDPTRDGLRDTPKRVAKAYVDATTGYATDARSIIGSAVFHEPLVSRGSGGIVLVRDIDFAATCDSTLMPFHGQCHVAYVPTDASILGLSKLARLVHAQSKRLCSPDGLCRELARAINDCIPCKGVYLQVSARHLSDAALQHRVSAESYTGLFDQPHSTHLKEARMLLRHGTRTPHSSASDLSSPSHPHLPPEPLPPAHLVNTVASKVSCMYARLLHGTGASLRPGAADTFARIFLRQTSGYFQTLPGVLAQHAQHAQHADSDGARPPAAVAAPRPDPTQLTDLRMHDGAPDSPASTPASDAADTADTTSASSCGMRSCSCRSGAAALAQHALPPRLAQLGFGSARSAGSDTSLSDRDALLPPSSSSTAVLAPLWEQHCGGRVRRHEAAQAAQPQHDSAAGSAQMWSVDFATQCEHHVLPFYGTLHAVVLDAGPCGGDTAAPPLSPECLCDIVDMFSLRLQVQERLTHQVADALHEATGGAVLIACTAAHMCMVARGVEKHAAETMTTAARGWLEEDDHARSSWLERLLERLSG